MNLSVSLEFWTHDFKSPIWARGQVFILHVVFNCVKNEDLTLLFLLF